MLHQSCVFIASSFVIIASCEFFAVIVSYFLTKYNCDLQVFTFNGVQRIHNIFLEKTLSRETKNCRKISMCNFYENQAFLS